MSHSNDFNAYLGRLRKAGVRFLLIAPVAILTGSVSAFFLWALDAMTRIRFQQPWLLFLLPLSGILVVWLYRQWGAESGKGTNLIIDEIHHPAKGVPLRMAPMVLVTTLLTHLFGGSAGREGTAVQMGSGLAGGFTRWFKVHKEHHRILLQAGVAAGFGSVFGTPIAGAIFAMEMLSIGRTHLGMLIPCLVAGCIGDLTCHVWGIHHTAYHIDLASPLVMGWLQLDMLLMCKVALAGIAFGLTARFFAQTAHAIQKGFTQWIPQWWLRPVIGAALVIGITFCLGTRAYLGLGVSSPDPSDVTILSAFHAGGATYWSWFWKLLLTAITLGCGFKGGEVTPLFFIGAALGNVLAPWLGVPVDLMAGVGLAAVFAGATNTPLACTALGMELFGIEHGAYVGIGCFVAYLCSGHTGIYATQRISHPKALARETAPGTTIGELQERRAGGQQVPPVN